MTLNKLAFPITMSLAGLANHDLDSPFDYVVVGGGTAGLTVASRLSEDEEVRILVVEAGGDGRGDPLILTPGCLTQLYGKDEYDWNFRSVPQVGGYQYLNRPLLLSTRG